jgi:ABC-2 type transport system permease protein
MQAKLDLLFIASDWRRFVLFLASDAAQAVAAVTAALLIAGRFGGIGPWTMPEIAFMLGYGQTVSSLLIGVFFGYNVVYMSRRIGRGQLDHSLIQPHSLAMTFATEGFTPFSGLGLLVPGLALLRWAAAQLHLTVDPGWAAWLVLQIVGSAAVLASFHSLWSTLAFWAPRGAEEITSETHQLIGELRPFPLDGLGSIAQAVMLSAAPIGFAAWYPSRALLHGTTNELLVTPAAGVLFAIAGLLVFRKGLAHYAQTGSSRYSDFGHRR